MGLPVRDVAGILADNLRLRGSVLPIPARRATAWARGLGIPRGGETVLYTGSMYQLIPYIERLVRLEQRLGNGRLAALTGLARRANRLVNGVSLVARPSAAERREYDRIPANVARLLQRAGVEFGYLYEDDLYSGALAHDLGADAEVAVHAHRVVAAFRKHGVRRVITIDPHTTNMLRSVYPGLVPGYDVRAQSYLEVLAERGPGGTVSGVDEGDGHPAVVAASSPTSETSAARPGRPPGLRVVIHDSCVYARYENVIDAPRRLLGAAGITALEPEQSRTRTWCCGGPAEALFPQTAAAVATQRVAQLQAVAPEGVTMCPICLVNLRKAADGRLHLRDISDYLVSAVAPESGGVAP